MLESDIPMKSPAELQSEIEALEEKAAELSESMDELSEEITSQSTGHRKRDEDQRHLDRLNERYQALNVERSAVRDSIKSLQAERRRGEKAGARLAHGIELEQLAAIVEQEQKAAEKTAKPLAQAATKLQAAQDALAKVGVAEAEQRFQADPSDANADALTAAKQAAERAQLYVNRALKEHVAAEQAHSAAASAVAVARHALLSAKGCNTEGLARMAPTATAIVEHIAGLVAAMNEAVTIAADVSSALAQAEHIAEQFGLKPPTRNLLNSNQLIAVSVSGEYENLCPVPDARRFTDAEMRRARNALEELAGCLRV